MKDRSYHEAAIIYNETLAECAENLAPTLDNEEVRKWSTSVGKQHRFHAKRHRHALNKLILKEKAAPVESIPDGLDVPPSEEETKVEEPNVDVSSPENVDSGNLPLGDGCDPHHNPTDPNCDFSPFKAKADG